MLRKNRELAYIFEKIADILEFLGDNPYRIGSYRRAASLISELPEDIEDLYRSRKLESLPGIGTSIFLKIEEFLKTGTVKKYEDLRKRVPEDLLELMEVPGIGPKTLRKVHRELNIKTREEFIKALKEGKLTSLSGFGEKKVENILKGLEIWQKAKERMILIEAYILGKDIVEYLKKLKEIINISTAGSLRRMKETVGDIDILVSAYRKDWKKIHEFFVKYPEILKILAKGETKSSVVLKNGRQVDLRTVEPVSWGAALQYFTGSKEHNIRIRDIAKEKSFRVNEYGIFNTVTGERLGGEREEDIYTLLGMAWIPPELRENWGEIELALEKNLPSLVDYNGVKGDFHVHTNWSDGVNSIEEVVQAAFKLGYEYIVIGDHSESARVANGLSPQRFRDQWKVIEELNRIYNPKGFHILRGCEVDILPDGRLDFPDSVLEEFDFVVASIHSRLNQDNTRRIIRAMENPNVNLIGHPTGRLTGQREGYPLNMEEIIKVASETGTALEINSFRADLSPENVRRCVEKGVKLAVVTDAHSIAHLPYITVGIGLARRGWATKEDILNTYSIKDIKEFVRLKRKR